MARGDATKQTRMDLHPSKIIAVHLNYPSRAAERGRSPETPSYFLKPPSSLGADGDPVVRPRECRLLAYEGELAVVIGRRARRVSPDRARDYIGYYTAANDFGVYDLRWADRGSNLFSKGQDGFTPVGPRLVPACELDLDTITLRTFVNGKVVQEARPSEMFFPVEVLIADLSRFITLEPGDLILTGTPANSRPVHPGDLVAVEVDGIGLLTSPIVEAGHDVPPHGAMPKVTEEARVAAFGDDALPARAGAVPTASADARSSSASAVGLGTHNRGSDTASAGFDSNTASADRDSDTASAGPDSSAASAGGGSGVASPGGGSGAAFVGAGSPRLSPEAEAALRVVATATLTSQLRRRGIRDTALAGLRPNRPDLRLLGYARTLRYVPVREDIPAELDHAGLNAQKAAIEAIQPEEVLVIDARGEAGAGTIGDVLALRALRRGAAGIVTDGAIRDSEAIGRLPIPTYHRAVHPAVLGLLHRPLEQDVPIGCAGVLVMPGDVLVGDADGVIVLPRALADEVALDALEQELREEYALECVDAGESVHQVFPLSDSRRPEYERWLAKRRADGGGPAVERALPQDSRQAGAEQRSAPATGPAGESGSRTSQAK